MIFSQFRKIEKCKCNRSVYRELQECNPELQERNGANPITPLPLHSAGTSVQKIIGFAATRSPEDGSNLAGACHKESGNEHDDSGRTDGEYRVSIWTLLILHDIKSIRARARYHITPFVPHTELQVVSCFLIAYPSEQKQQNIDSKQQEFDQIRNTHTQTETQTQIHSLIHPLIHSFTFTHSIHAKPRTTRGFDIWTFHRSTDWTAFCLVVKRFQRVSHCCQPIVDHRVLPRAFPRTASAADCAQIARSLPFRVVDFKSHPRLCSESLGAVFKGKNGIHMARVSNSHLEHFESHNLTKPMRLLRGRAMGHSSITFQNAFP